MVNIIEIEEKIKVIIYDQLNVQGKDVIPEASFADDLGADSLDQVELIMAIEEKFNVSISDKDVKNITTVQNVIDYIKNVLA